MRKVLPVLAAIVLAQSFSARAAEGVWLEAERFEDLGGWTLDAQFIDQMGSPYLLAIGLGKPVKDAVTRVALPKAGTYRLWVRCRDWVPEHSPGRFQVLLDGKTVEHTFGASKEKGWVWEDGGTHELKGDNAEVRLHDLTGDYGRCDALVLVPVARAPSPVPPAEFRPSNELKTLAEQRLQHGGVSAEEKRLEPYDVVVVGGGLAGTCAAVAAARLGCRVALLQNRPLLGGNASTEVLVPPGGDETREPLDPGETGVVEEFRGSPEGYSERMLRVVRTVPNLDLCLNTHATGVEMKSAREIAAVKAVHVATGRRVVFPARIVIDCTGDAAIGVAAGAAFRHGREPRSMYGEPRAPEKADAQTMGNTLRYATAVRENAAPFEAPPWARKFPDCSDFGPQRHPHESFGNWQWVIEYGGIKDTYADAEDIRDELLRIVFGMWGHVKNHCPRLKEKAARCELAWVGHVAGTRENRRLLGDYVLTEHDIANATLFPDRVGYGGWGIDLHPPGGFYSKKPPATFSHRKKFSIPFRSLCPKDLDNLMMAGRNVSVSHVALGATRLMLTHALMGQAVGTAAKLCLDHQATPRELAAKHVAELQQQLLKDGCYIVDLPNQDPRDLARTATVTASSYPKGFVAPGEPPAQPGLAVHPLGCDRAVMFTVTGDRIEKLSLFLRSENANPTEIKVTLRPAKELGDFSSRKSLATATATAPPKSQSWVEFGLKATVAPGLYYAWLPKTAGLGWELFPEQPPGTSRAYGTDPRWTTMLGCYKHKLEPAPEAAAVEKAVPKVAAETFAPQNVIDGYARAVRGMPHAWQPDPKQAPPHWVQLDFGKPVAFNGVHVTFQNQAMAPDAFQIEAWSGERWRPVVQMAGGVQRRQVVTFERTTASKVRLAITQARRRVGVCEMRVYDEPAPPEAKRPPT